MSERDKQIGEALGAVIPILPEEKKEYFLGFAEGVAAMASMNRNLAEEDKTPSR